MKTQLRLHLLSLLMTTMLLFFNTNLNSQSMASEVFPVGYNSTVIFTWDAATDFPLEAAAELECYDIEFVATYREHNTQNGLSFAAADVSSTTTPTGSPGGGGCGAVRTFTIPQDFDAICFDGSTTFSIDVTRLPPVGGGTTCGGGNLDVEITATITNTILHNPPDDTAVDGQTLSRNTSVGANDCEVTEAELQNWLLNPARIFDNNATCTPAGGLTFTSFTPAGPYTETCSTGVPYTISYTVEDDCGNATSGSFDLNVVDNQDPVIVDASPVIDVPVDGTACDVVLLQTILDSLISTGDFTVTDNCTIADTTIVLASGSLTIPTGDCDIRSRFTVTVTDECGRTTDEDFNVDIIDNNAPILNGLPSSVDYNSCSDALIADVSDAIEALPWTAVDGGCSGAADIVLEYSDDPTFATNVYNGATGAGDNFPVSYDCMNATKIYIRSTDLCGNVDETFINVNVKDTELPDVTGLTTITRGTGSANCFVTEAGVITQIKNNDKLSDNCTDDDDLTIVITGSSPAPANPGEYTETCSTGSPWVISYSATDECGNTETGTFNLNVNDNSDPLVTGNAPVNIYLDATCALDSSGIVDQAMANLYANGYLATDNCDMMLDSTISNMSKLSFDNLACGMTNSTCFTYSSTDTPIPVNDVATVVSTIVVTDPGNITDLNILNFDLPHTWPGDLDISLLHVESNTVAMFWDNDCGAPLNDDILANFDDSGGAIVCPPNGGGTFAPTDPFSVFNGLPLAGTWVVLIDDDFDDDDGTLEGWTLELCSDVASEMGSFDVTYVDDCQAVTGASAGFTTVTVNFLVLDSIKPTLVLPPVVTVSNPANCPSIFGSEVLAALIADPAFVAMDNCTDVDTILSYNNNAIQPFGPGFGLPVTCSGTYKIRVELVDICGPNTVFDSLDVIVQDLSPPDISGVAPSGSISRGTGSGDCVWPLSSLEDYIRDNSSDDCATDSDDLVVAITGGLAGGYTETCTSGTPYTIMYTVTDTCSNTSAIGTFDLNINDNADPTTSGTTLGLTIYFDADCELDSADIVDQAIAAAWEGGFSITDNCMDLDSLISGVTTVTGPACPMIGTFNVLYFDACGNEESKDFGFEVVDTTDAVTTIPASITIDMDESCQVFGAEVKAAIEADAGYALPIDNCEVIDTIYSWNGSDYIPGGGGGWSWTVQCSDTYRVEVRTVDCGGNITIDSLDVTIEDKVKPNVDVTSVAVPPTLINTFDACELDSLDVLGQLDLIIAPGDNCGGPVTTSIDLSTFNAECGNAHSVMYTVMDGCLNDSTIEVIFMIEEQGGPNLDILDPLFGAGSGTMLMDPPFPLDAGGFTPTDPNDLYGDDDNNPNNGENIYHDNNEPIYQTEFPFIGFIPNAPLLLEVNGTCGLTIADIKAQILANPGLRVSDGCTDSITMVNNMVVKIRENELDYDLDLTNDIDLANLECGSFFGVIAEIVDDCGNVKTVGFNAEISENVAPVLTASANDLTINAGPNDCGPLTYAALVDSLFDSGILTVTGICNPDDLTVGLWMDNPETPGDENGIDQDFYAGIFDDGDPGAGDAYFLTADCIAQDTTIYVRVGNGCTTLAGLLLGDDLAVSNVVPIKVSFVDINGPEVDIEPTQTMTVSNGCELDSLDVLDRLINNKLDGVVENCNGGVDYSISESGPFSAVCGMNVHSITFNVSDACGNVTSVPISLTIYEDDPEPNFEILGSGGLAIGVDIELNDDPFPLPANTASSQPDSLYGGNNGALDDANDWHDGSVAVFQVPDGGGGFMPDEQIEVSLDMSCAITMADLQAQIEALVVITDADDCSPTPPVVTVEIRENTLSYDLDATNDVDLSTAVCGLEFGVVVTVTTGCGFADIQGFNVIVVDDIAPVLSAPASLTINRSDVADCRLSPNELRDALLAAGVTTTGLCGDLDLQIWLDNPDTPDDENGSAGDLYGFDVNGNPDFGNRLEAGCTPQNLEVYLNATEDCGNATSNTSAAITVEVSFIDDVEPTITFGTELDNVLNNMTITRTDGNDAATDCLYNVSLTDKLSSDNICNADTLTFSAPGVTIFDNGTQDVGTFPVGTHVVTAVATDDCGNTADTTFTVVILDVTNPTMSCNQLRNSFVSVAGSSISTSTTNDWDKRVDTDPGACYAQLEYTLPLIEDECSVASVAITYYDDSSGTPVSIGSDVGGLAGGTVHTFQFPAIDGAGDPNADTRVEIIITDASGNTRTCNTVVRVRDQEAPTVACTNVTVQLDANGIGTVGLANLTSYNDNCSVMLVAGQTSYGCSDIGQTNLTTFVIEDESGNQASCASLVEVQDNIAPTLTFANNDPNGASVFLDCGDPYIELFPDFLDNCPATGQIMISGNVDVNTPGTYFVFYDAVDASGNPAPTLTRTIVVGNGLGSPGGAVTGAALVCAGTMETYTFTGTVPSGVQVNWSYSGVNGIIMGTGQDGAGNETVDVMYAIGATSGDVVVTLSSDCDFFEERLAVTIDAPVATCQDISVTLNPVIATITAADIDGGSSSNCGGLSLSITPDPTIFTCFDVGVNTITLTVTDDSGATSTCDADVTVIDPNASAPGTISGDAVVCSGKDGYQYTITPDPGVPITWSHVDPLNGPNVNFTTQGSNVVIANYQDLFSLSDGYCVVDANGTPAGSIVATYTPGGSCPGAAPVSVSFPVTYMDDEMCSVYNCFLELHVNTGLSAANSPDLYAAEIVLSSDAVIDAGRDIEFNAGQCVELKPGFEVELNAALLADIVPCISQAFTRGEADLLIDLLEKENIQLDRKLLNITNE